MPTDPRTTPLRPDDPRARAAAAPWPALGTAGVGSMPGTDVREATTVVVGELDVPHLVELPARGPGADMIGRTAALLAGVSGDLAVRTTPTGWRLTASPGREVRRAAAFLREDLDVLEELTQGYVGPLLLPLAGPWTLAASIELATGEPLLRDRGAVRELAAALAEAAAAHVRDVAVRVPGASLTVQLDEPSLPMVLGGAVPTQSGWSRVRAQEPPVVSETLAQVTAAVAAAGARPAVHCCAARPPYEVLRGSGAVALSIDLLRHDDRDDDATGEALDAGMSLVLGVVPTTTGDEVEPARSGVDASVGAVERWRHRLGLDLDQVAPLLALSPTCGLAGASPDHARAILRTLREVSRRVREEAPEHG